MNLIIYIVEFYIYLKIKIYFNVFTALFFCVIITIQKKKDLCKSPFSVDNRRKAVDLQTNKITPLSLGRGVILLMK